MVDENGDKPVKWNQRFPIDIDPFPEEETTQPFETFDLNDEATKKEDFIPSHLPPYPPSHTIEKKSNKRKHNTLPPSHPNKKIAPEIIKNASTIAAKIEEAADSIVSESRIHHHPKH